MATRYFHINVHCTLILYQVLCKASWLLKQSLPLGAGSLGLTGILQVICTKCLTFLDTWKTFCLIMFVHLMNSSILPASPFRFLMKKYAMSYNFIFSFIQHLTHGRRHSITVFGPQQSDLCLRPYASEGSIYHTHNYKCVKTPAYCASLARWSQLWRNTTCNPKQPFLRLIESISSSLAPCPQNKRWPCLIGEGRRLCHRQHQKQASFPREGFEEQNCLGKWKIQIN